MDVVIISIKLIAGISVAIALTILLIYGSGYRWYDAFVVGVLAYSILSIGSSEVRRRLR
jgi:hypothetical protein